MSKEKGKVIMPEPAQLIEKWLPVIEAKDKWAEKLGDVKSVDSKHYGMLATSLEVLEQVELKEETVSGDVAKYNPVLIPMARRIMPALIGYEVMGTQPMTGPTGLIFALRSSYQNDSVNSLKRATDQILTLADASTFTVGGDITTAGDAKHGVVRHKEGNNILVDMVTANFFVATDAVDDAQPFVGSVTTVSAAYDTERLVNIIFSNYAGGPDATATAEQLGTDMKEVGFDIESTQVTAKSRKLKAKWKIELEEDLQAIHGMSAEQLLSQIASEEIVLEMNREMINILNNNATDAGSYDYDAGGARWEIEQNAELVAKLGRVSKDIAAANFRGPGNFMIVNLDTLNALEHSKLWVSNEWYKLNMGNPVQSAHAGTISGMKVYVDIWQTASTALVGYKGANEIDAGYYFAPYVPLKISKGFGEEDGQPRLFFTTRYGTVANPFGAANYYQKLTLVDIPS